METKIVKLIYLSSSLLPSKAANSIHVTRMCSAFTEYCNEVTLVCRTEKSLFDSEEILSSYGVKNHFSVLAIKPWFAKFQSLLALPRTLGFLLKHDKSSTLIYGRDVLAVAIANFLGFNCGYEFHSVSDSKVVRFLESYLFKSKNTNTLVCISQKLKEDYCELYPAFKDKIVVAHDGADCPPVELLETTECLNKQNVKVGYIGHLYAGRGIDIIIECAKLLPNIQFEIYGGVDSDIEECKKISPPNMRYHGFIKPSQTARARASCDILVMPYQKKLSIYGKNVNTSRWMSPMKLFEYMSAKKAILSSDLPVLREVLNETNSVLVSADDVNAWQDAIYSLSQDPERRKQLAERAYLDFTKKFTWSARAKLISNLLSNR